MDRVELDLRNTQTAGHALDLIRKAFMDRESLRTAPPMIATWRIPDDDPTPYFPPPRFRKVTVSPWTNDELRLAAAKDAFRSQTVVQVDYMDGRGPRIQVCSIVADIDRNMPDYLVALE